MEPDGSIASEFFPKFPTQVSNISYGAVFDSTALVDDGSIAHIFVPGDGSLSNDWLQSSFDASSWSTGALTLGFGVQEPGFDVTYIKSNVVVGDLDAARDVLADGTKQSLKVNASASVVNYLGNGGTGRFRKRLTLPHTVDR